MTETLPQKPIIELTEEQATASRAAIAFVKSGKSGELRIGGYAGTGKTTLIKSIIAGCEKTDYDEPLDGISIAVAALSGKAVSVLRRKGVRQAKTIHRMIYNFDPRKREFFRKESLSESAIIIDEASMVNRTLYDDIHEFRLPTVFIGDMGQLEPIGDDVNLMDESRLNYRLEKIHRQAEGNAILEFATVARNGYEFWHGKEGDVEIASKSSFWGALSWADQIIVGKNHTRHGVNARIRNNAGRGGKKLCEGERIICIQNNRDFGIFNGMMMTVEKIHDENEERITADLRTEDGEDRTRIPLMKSSFGRDKNPDDRFMQHLALCDYGYCITAHKSQGSEWDKVLVLEEKSPKWDMNRWRYTAITRAAKELIYCI